MTETTKRPAVYGAPRAVAITAVSVMPDPDDGPWWADTAAATQWWESPALAWRRGFDDGLRAGREEAEREWCQVLLDAFGTDTPRAGVEALLRHREQLAARSGGAA